MTIDEAIARERKMAEMHRNDIVPKENYHNMPWIDKNNEASMRSVKEHEQLADWLEELKMYKEVGMVEEFQKLKENQEINKELESHDEKHILKYCIGLMQEMVDEFAEWYRWQHGENAIEELDEEEKFCVRKTYFRIVQELFLLNTRHSGGNSTRAKCKQLGVYSSEEIEFGWGEEE